MPRQLGRRSKRTLPPPGKRIMSLQQLDDARLKAEPNFAPYIPASPAIFANKGGRPTSYRPEFCETVLNDASLGHTLGATAARIGVARSTLSDWAHRFPEFAEAIELAKGIGQRFYEGHLIDIARRGGDSTRMSAIKLGLFNVGGQDWKDRITADHNVTFSLGDLIKLSIQLEGKIVEGDGVKTADPDDGGTIE
jgi:hypothetical protein